MYFLTINGKSVQGTGAIEKIYNPATGEVLAEFNSVSAEPCNEALSAADSAFKLWSKKSIEEREKSILSFRQELIEKQDELVKLLMDETGKSLNNATYDYEMLINCLHFFNEENKRLYGKIIPNRTTSHLNIIEHVPLGVVVGYLAFNFPILNLGYKLGPILASGCTCVLKPSSLTTLTSLKIGEGINAGSVLINEPLYDFNLPHGGLKESGIGKECSLYSLEEYYYVKRLSIKRKG
ncbi:hypothetical protein AN641_08150 [Candidatus Epulonipiscioides gigas]|nr:hypothetical protein AN641_08150 [Epulopiscium sp. SCG-C07WGA-EpuloA2]